MVFEILLKISGLKQPQIMQLSVKIREIQVQILIGLKSIHYECCDYCSVTASNPRGSVFVVVANGELIPWIGVCDGVQVMLGGEDTYADLYH